MDNMQITPQTKVDIERSISNLQDKKTDAANEKIKYQNELSDLKLKIRNRGGRLIPKIEYDTICQKQDAVKRKMLVVDSYIAELKKEIRSKEVLRSEINLILNGDVNQSSLVNEIIKLRDKYMEFSSDNTRVSSTRLMASRFSEDLDAIVKSCK